jgi:phospholipid/cholesterol/gamma-HCH transport system substrate-binding protein
MSDIAKDVKEVTKALATSVGSEQGKQDIQATLRNLAQVTEALNQTVRENREAIHEIVTNTREISTRSGPEIQAILENVRETTRDVRELVAKDPTGRGDTGEVRKIVERVDKASQNLESALKNVDDVTARLNRGEGTLGRLSKDEKLINEVEGAVENVGDFLGGISRLQTIVSLRTDYQFLASTVKSYVEIRLQPKEDKYYLLEIVNDPKGLTRFEQTDVDTTNPNDPPHYREVRTVTTNSLRFSLSPVASASRSPRAAWGSIPRSSTGASSCVKTSTASVRSCCRAGASHSATNSSIACGCWAASKTS